MCGICGTVRFDDHPVLTDDLRRACVALRHRGPNHDGVWLDNKTSPRVGLGAVRLIVVDPSPSCGQPMHDASGRFHLAYNGELYNFRALRDELRSAGASFDTEGDTEVVLAACARWGVNALPRLDGIWGLAFFDARDRTGFLARDRYGVKPLLYTTHTHALSFASEMRGLTALVDFDRSVDERALVHLLRFGFVPDPSTIYANVRRLEPGHVLRFGPSGADGPTPYLSVERTPSDVDGPVDFPGACAAVHRLIGDAVARQRLADVPMGAFLSGGLDSSIIVHHLAAVSARPVKTFSVGYAGAGAYDETPFARVVARRYGTDHREITVSDTDVLAVIPRLFDHLGEPVGDSSIIPTAIISEFAARHVTVVLSGDGGDELFGGYWRYLGHEAVRAYERIPATLRRRIIEPMLRRLGSSRTSPWQNRIRQLRKLLRSHGGDALDRHVSWCAIMAPEAMGVFNEPQQVLRCDEHVRAGAHRCTSGIAPSDGLNRVLAFDLRYQLPSDMLRKVDLAGMMHSLEVRVPLLDQAVVGYVEHLPPGFKIRGGLRKRLLVDAYRGRLPDEVLDREKQGFEVPIGEYLRGALQPMFRDVVTRDVVASFGLFSYSAVTALFDDHVARRGEHADILFALLSLCWWRRSGG